MRKILSLILFVVTITLPYTASAILSMELTRGVAGAIPVAVVPFAGAADAPQDVSGVVTNDLTNSGRFKVFGRNALSEFPSEADQVSVEYFRRLGTDNVVIGKVNALSGDRYNVRFQLLDMFRGKGAERVVLEKNYTVSGGELRKLSHHISDLIYERITGVRGVFSTKIAYVVIQRPVNAAPRYILEVSDQDGYNPRPLLNSPEPIMSPSWSPNGRQIAYVSFENRKAGIYLQDVMTGGRRLLSEFPGINGAPAWSPDGGRLALVLSKSGSPNIYVMDIGSGSLTQITRDYYINTEPAWAPDGKSLLYTSNRSGGPQIYQANLASGASSRVSFDGDYNARASFTRDGKYIAMIHKVSGIYNIGLLDLDTGTMRVLGSSAGDSASPSIAPNGSMILYDTVYGGRNVLAMVSTDGRIQLRLPARNGEAQDPAWSPFMG
ncbi:Protein TolB [Aquicella siphonis]|uniref:Tol-Pal system protein TolB n=1 Tax=Aquicella siphonis TaxID=254247 RepID=A0A5E4PG09_9COXI|nr:Tol-Pal system beta propeller repeat protein TolB [Aquicella siphonis]VVC75301.1 Protein TolB [Aquicella siphonis]